MIYLDFSLKRKKNIVLSFNLAAWENFFASMCSSMLLAVLTWAGDKNLFPWFYPLTEDKMTCEAWPKEKGDISSRQYRYSPSLINARKCFWNWFSKWICQVIPNKYSVILSWYLTYCGGEFNIWIIGDLSLPICACSEIRENCRRG